jgi:hypothetical protein
MKTGRTLVVAVLASALAGCATGGATRVGGRHPEILFPGSSPVTPVPSDEPAGARFAGRYAMTGRFRYEVDATGGLRVLEFVPDRADADRLPYFADLGHVQAIAFDNPSSFVEEAIPAAILTRLAKGELTSHSGRARIVVEGLFAAVRCDQPGYTVNFVEVEWIADTASSSVPSPPGHDGCRGAGVIPD